MSYATKKTIRYKISNARPNEVLHSTGDHGAPNIMHGH